MDGEELITRVTEILDKYKDSHQEKSSNQKLLARLEVLWVESRSEIKQRITQRDQYFLRMYVSFGLVFAAAYKESMVLVLLPIVALYFSVLISSSYQIHQKLTAYLKNDIEPKIKKIVNSDDGDYVEFESMFASDDLNKGARTGVYEKVTYAVSALSPLSSIVMFKCIWEPVFVVISAAVCTLAWCVFNKDKSSENKTWRGCLSEWWTKMKKLLEKKA